MPKFVFKCSSRWPGFFQQSLHDVGNWMLYLKPEHLANLVPSNYWHYILCIVYEKVNIWNNIVARTKKKKHFDRTGIYFYNLDSKNITAF